MALLKVLVGARLGEYEFLKKTFDDVRLVVAGKVPAGMGVLAMSVRRMAIRIEYLEQLAATQAKELKTLKEPKTGVAP